MSASQDKARRRTERYREALIQAHDRLHKDDVEGCHEVLHAGLGGARELPGGVAPMGHTTDFDRAFRDLCMTHGRQAAYVLVDGERLMSGGDAQVSAAVDSAMRSALEVRQ